MEFPSMSEVVSTASPLADSFQRCSRSFKGLYLALFAYGPISLSRFNDEYGRFGVWGGDSGADRTGRGSLDDVLRNDPKTTLIITEVLENLDEDLNACIALVEASTGSLAAQSHDGQEWLSDEDSSVSSGSGVDDGQTESRIPSKTQRILHLLAIIVDHIQSLFQVSTLLRRPTISDKYLRSASKRTTVENKSPFLHWDLAHIVEKRRLWINQHKWHLPADVDNAENISHQKSNHLCKRLAIANVRRREQLDFWQAHPAQPSAIKLPNEPIRPKPAAIPDPILTGQLLKKVVPRSEISKPSHGTQQSFSTVAKSDLNDSATFSGRPRTEYVSSTKGGKYVLRVPTVSKISDDSPTLKCPYCSTTLDAKSMSQRELWKKHVFRDLRPYVCTFEQCENPEKLYLTRHDWMYHETQMHRRQWICASCSHRKFPSRNDMKNHLLAKHAGGFPESQLAIMVDICERPMDDDEDADCPICLATLSLFALRVHLATHLEELALFVLPCQMEDWPQDVGSDKAEGAAGQHLASDVSSSEDGLPHLDFEESLPNSPHSQDPKIFSAHLHSQTEFEHKRMDDWFLTNDLTEPQDERNPCESPSVSHYNQLNTTDFMDFGAYCPLDGTEWIALGSDDNMALSLRTGAQDYHGHTESQDIGLQHDSIGGEPTYSRSEAGLIPNNISASWEMEIDGPINGAIAPLPEEPDESPEPTDEETIQIFLSKVSETRRLQQVVEQLTANIVDRPEPKSAVTLGNILTSLESLTGERIRRLNFRVQMILPRTCIELQTCIECMKAIIEVAQGNLRQPSSAPVGEVSIWMPGIDMENFASTLKSYTETMHYAATKIAEQYLGELSRPLALWKVEDAAKRLI